MLSKFEKPITYIEFLKTLMPSIITMVLLSFYTTIDGYFVAKYVNSDALATINIVIPIICIVFGVAVMLATGSSAIIGEKLGQKKYVEANNIFSFICLALGVFGVLFTISGLLFLEDIVSILGASEKLLPHIKPYAWFIFLGTIPMVFKVFFEYLSRTDGNPKVSLIMAILGLSINVVLDYIFIAKYNLGTTGAGLGTFISIFISFCIGLFYFLKLSSIRFVKPTINWSVLLKACSNGSSEMFTELSTGITTFLFNFILFKYYQENGIAAITIIMYIYYFFASFYLGISAATAPIISFNLGRKNDYKIQEILKYSFWTICGTSILILMTSYFAGSKIISIFTHEQAVFNLTLYGFKIFYPVFLFLGVNIFLSGYFTALGNGTVSATISMLRSFVFIVIFIFSLPYILGVKGIWATVPFSETLTVFISYVLYKKFGRIWLTRNNKAI